jgi:hypothetical protein
VLFVLFVVKRGRAPMPITISFSDTYATLSLALSELPLPLRCDMNFVSWGAVPRENVKRRAAFVDILECGARIGPLVPLSARRFDLR